MTNKLTKTPQEEGPLKQRTCPRTTAHAEYKRYHWGEAEAAEWGRATGRGRGRRSATIKTRDRTADAKLITRQQLKQLIIDVNDRLGLSVWPFPQSW